MKIVHVYAKNLEIFVDAVKGTECKLNASKDINYMLNSLQNFNARDVIGLVIFANPMTKKCVKLVHKFDELFVFKTLPIIIVSDAATELCNRGYFKVKYSKLFALNSEENSISDLDMSAIFTTLLTYANSVYDLSSCIGEKRDTKTASSAEAKELVMSDDLHSLLSTLKERGVSASNK